MIPHVPKQRQSKSNASKPFNDLVEYIEEDKGQEKAPRPLELEPSIQQAEAPVKNSMETALSDEFADILDYAASPVDKETERAKCIAIRTHGVTHLATASAEMNAVAKKNTRCSDPAFHFILSWPEHEKPSSEAVFDAAEHAIKSLGLGEHQYVIAIHGNTDNLHCHIAVNRVHPITYKSHHIEWATKTLHMAARQSEIKHGWSHDRGIYIVEMDGHGKKSIVLNTKHAANVNQPEHGANLARTEPILATWHDQEGLDSWLKSKVNRALKKALPELTDWQALHAWLSKHDITLSDSGGGGLRVYATSPETGEVIDLAASKGLRAIKRKELESRWGGFASPISVSVPVPNLRNLTPKQLEQGAINVLTTPLRFLDPVHGRERSADHLAYTATLAAREAAQRTGRLHELSNRQLDAGWPRAGMLLPPSVLEHLDLQQTGQDHSVRRPGERAPGGRGGSSGSRGGHGLRSQYRDTSKRDERREARAAARVDLRKRFAQYRRVVAGGDTDYFVRAKDAKVQRTAELKALRTQIKEAKSAIPRGLDAPVRLIAVVELDAASTRRKLEIEASYQARIAAIRATRTPPLTWREWLFEQSNLGDQAALSALRGIVYQAQRDAKDGGSAQEEAESDKGQRYKNAIERLLEEEKAEIAIRAARRDQMRPYEVDALLTAYRGIQWRVTGNGNVEFQARSGIHLFTDRGNRLTFDKVRVEDEDIRLALVHAQQKFGHQLILTGDNLAFSERVAKLATDMGIVVLNPELQEVIESHKREQVAPAQKSGVQDLVEQVEQQWSDDLERALHRLVRSIDPRAKFITPAANTADIKYVGPIVAHLIEPRPGFAQHVGNSVFVLHGLSLPHLPNAEDECEISYSNGVAQISLPEPFVSPDLPGTIGEETKQPQSVYEWIQGWATSTGKQIVQATTEDQKTVHTILYVAPDGVAVNRGRSVAVYKLPEGAEFAVGDKVVVDSNGGLLHADKEIKRSQER